jgi:hypothetical protein
MKQFRGAEKLSGSTGRVAVSIVSVLGVCRPFSARIVPFGCERGRVDPFRRF